MMSKTVVGALCALAMAAGTIGPTVPAAEARVRIYMGQPPYPSPCWHWSSYRQKWVWACQVYPQYQPYPLYQPFPFFFGFGFGDGDHHRRHHHNY